jgi:hypothetical protein
VKRRYFKLAAAVSLLLFVATVLLWVRSYWSSDAITYGNASGKYGIQSASGSIVLVTVRVPLPEGSSEHGLSGIDDNAAESFVNWQGFHYIRNPVPFSSPRTQSLPEIVYPLASIALVVPFWAVTGFSLLAPLTCWVVAKCDRWMN